MRAAVVILLCGLMVAAGCTRDRAIVLQPVHIVCDSTSPGYHSCIRPIFEVHCYGCHSDSATAHGSLGFDIEDFSQLKNYLTYYYHNDSVYGSKFMRAIAHGSGVLVMPPSYRMPDSSISLIRSWISRGAPDS